MIDKFREKFQLLSTREKTIVTATFLLSLWAAWDGLYWSPLRVQQQRLQQELSRLEQQVSGQPPKDTKLVSDDGAAADQKDQQKLAELTAEYERLQTAMSQQSEKFVTARIMVSALNGLLNPNQQLTLLKFETLPATALGTAINPKFPIYKHAVAITFAGDYDHMLAYLRALEALPWQIKWDSIDYQVKTYPAAEITIQVYTLSDEKNWLEL